MDDTSIPFGEIREVMGAMDLRKKVKIGTLLDDLEDDWIGMLGWDVFFFLRENGGECRIP